MGFTALLGFVVVGYLVSLDQAFGLVNLPRQSTTNIPAQCASLCNPVQVQIDNGGCTPSACCTSDFDNGYFNCLQCVGNGLGVTDFSAAQVLVDDLFVACADVGEPVPKLTFPGQDANRFIPGQPISSGGSASSATSSSRSVSSSISTSPPSLSTSHISQSTLLPTPPPESVTTTFSASTQSRSNRSSTVTSLSSTTTSPAASQSSVFPSVQLSVTSASTRTASSSAAGASTTTNGALGLNSMGSMINAIYMYMLYGGLILWFAF